MFTAYNLATPDVGKGSIRPDRARSDLRHIADDDVVFERDLVDRAIRILDNAPPSIELEIPKRRSQSTAIQGNCYACRRIVIFDCEILNNNTGASATAVYIEDRPRKISNNACVLILE